MIEIMVQTQCRWFNGYKPCTKNSRCSEHCASKSIVQEQVLVVHLEALGAVLRATSLLPAIVRKHPGAYIVWVTKAPADQLLQNNSLIDRVLTLSPEDLLTLENFEFGAAYCIDKSLVASGLIKKLKVKNLFGFTSTITGGIIPATSSAEELWNLGLSDDLKFYHNKKPETQLMHEALELGEFRREEYELSLNQTELKVTGLRRELWAAKGEVLVGLNTGCASTIPAKKMSIEAHRQLISELSKWPLVKVVLLGGKEDTLRNQAIAEGFECILSPTDRGLRDGLCSVAACDIVVTGDSLGMHMAIALKKWVVAWFGPTCEQEIDLYDRGEKILAAVSCSPCWKRSCHKDPMCYDQVPLADMLGAIQKGIQWKSSLSKQPSSETFSSASRY